MADENKSHHHVHSRESDQQQQDPPGVVVERSDLLCPSDRREPRQPTAHNASSVVDDRTVHVADRAQHEGNADRGTRQAVGRTSTVGDLRRHGCHSGKRDSGPTYRGAQRERTDDRQTDGDRSQCNSQCKNDVRTDRYDQCGGQERSSTYHRCTDHLGSAGLLVLSRMANHREGAHQCGHQREHEHRLTGDYRALRITGHDPVGRQRDRRYRGTDCDVS